MTLDLDRLDLSKVARPPLGHPVRPTGHAAPYPRGRTCGGYRHGACSLSGDGTGQNRQAGGNRDWKQGVVDCGRGVEARRMDAR